MKKNIIIYIIMLIIAISGFIVTLNYYNNKKKFQQPTFDKTAKMGEPAVEENLGYMPLDAEGLYKIALCGKPKIENNKLKLYLTSDETNSVYLKARIYKNNKIVGESGLIKTGEYIEYIPVKNISINDEITVKIMGYEIENYYSAGIVNIDLTVR